MRTRTIFGGLFALTISTGLLITASSSPISARTSDSTSNCNSSSACVQGSNSGSGAGVEGDTTAASQTAFRAGLMGIDMANPSLTFPLNNVGAYGKSDFGAGVAGQTKHGFGVVATNSDFLVSAEGKLRDAERLDFICTGAIHGDDCAVVGSYNASSRERSTSGLFVSKTGIGLVGITDRTSNNVNFGAAGVLGQDTSLQGGTQNRGIEGDSQMGYGSLGFTFNASGTTGVSRAGVLGVDDSLDGGTLNVGVEAFAHGTGVLAFSDAPLAHGGSPQAPAIMAICGGGGPAFIANDGMSSPSGDVASLDCAGNLILAGSVVQGGSPLLKTNTPSGPVATYAARSTRPAIEDDGEAQMVNGYAQVAIDRAFGATIDRGVPYLVFITPDGPNQGLYVLNKTPSGFSVRENGSGRSSLTFDYRIVAAPADTPMRRLPSLSQALGDLRKPVHGASRVGSFPIAKPV